MKAIFAKHIMVGDDILVSGGRRLRVINKEYQGDRVKLSVISPIGKDAVAFDYVCMEYDIIGLGHRPWQKGQSGPSMFHNVVFRAWSLAEAERAMTGESDAYDKLREAVEAYELGRSEKK